MTNFQSKSKQTTSLTKEPIIGVPVRFYLISISFFAFIIVYANKVILSVAIVEMVSDNHLLTHNLTELDVNRINQNRSQFSSIDQISQNQVKINQIYYKSPETKSKALGAFFWGYIIVQVPAGRLAERFGAKW